MNLRMQFNSTNKKLVGLLRRHHDRRRCRRRLDFGVLSLFISLTLRVCVLVFVL